MAKKKTPIKQNKNFLIILLSSFLILIFLFIGLNNIDRYKHAGITRAYTFDFCGFAQPGVRFEISIPNDFILNQKEGHTNAVYEFKNDNTYFELSCGDGFGGGCDPQSHMKFEINGQEVDSCYNNEKAYFQSYIKTDDGKITFSLQSNIKDKNLLMQILSSFNILN